MAAATTITAPAITTTATIKCEAAIGSITTRNFGDVARSFSPQLHIRSRASIASDTHGRSLFDGSCSVHRSAASMFNHQKVTTSETPGYV